MADDRARTWPRAEAAVMLLLFAGAASFAIGALFSAVFTIGGASMGDVPMLSVAASYEWRPADWQPSDDSEVVRFTEASVRSDITAAALWLTTVGSVVGSLTTAAVATAVAFLCLRVLRGRPFTRALTNAGWVAGAALTIGGMLHQGLTGLGTMEAAAAASDLPEIGSAFEIGFTFELTPVAAGFAVLVVATVLELGQRMQARVTELERETAGLV